MVSRYLFWHHDVAAALSSSCESLHLRVLLTSLPDGTRSLRKLDVDTSYERFAVHPSRDLRWVLCFEALAGFVSVGPRGLDRLAVADAVEFGAQSYVHVVFSFDDGCQLALRLVRPLIARPGEDRAQLFCKTPPRC